MKAQLESKSTTLANLPPIFLCFSSPTILNMPKCNRNNNEQIKDDATRKITYNKRKKGLMTKLDQITTLCGVEACAIINAPYTPGFEVWPNDDGVVRVVEKFMSMSDMDRRKHMENKTRYLENRIKKVGEKIKKRRMLNRGLEMDNLMSDCLSCKVSVADDLDIPNKQAISSLADQNLLEIEKRFELLMKNGTPADAPPTSPPPPQLPKDVECYVPVMENQGPSNESETSWHPTKWLEDNWDRIRGDGASSSKTT